MWSKFLMLYSLINHRVQLRASRKDIVKKTNGNIDLEKIFFLEGNIVIFVAPRKAGELLVVKHFS
ncbi:hypothetical protein BST97_05310 [Nonlabens spongiae]|uniref:Uncharacterized protein n=1 Tax=Nonlabens spongiae TaxID=331648 RepID=A0A1W6MIK8_9FLAO|nr:hypothetical protein BST97_05310 [Nonlabens spongiae]